MSNYTVLLIDYEPKSIDRVRRPLTGIGYRVEVATDGVSGIEAFHRIKPDLVMIEAMIPKKHGFEVCQELKKTPQGKRTPIIITTSVYKGRKYRNQAFHLHGCDEYIEKPIDEVQIVEICQRMLGDPGSREVPAEAIPMQSREEQEVSLSEPGPLAPLEAFPDPVMAMGMPAGADDDELEIMARLDAILPGGGDGGSRDRGKPAPPARHEAPPAELPSQVGSDPFATSFLSGTTSALLDAAKFPSHDPTPLEEGTTAIPLATESKMVREASVGEAVAAEDSESEEDASQLVSFEPGRSRKKQRRKKSSSPFSSQGSSSSAVAAPVLDEVAEPEALPDRMPLVEPAAVTRRQEEAAPTVAEAAPLFAFQQEEERRPWWLSAAIALVLIGAAGALIYLYLGGLFGGGGPH